MYTAVNMKKSAYEQRGRVLNVLDVLILHSRFHLPQRHGREAGSRPRAQLVSMKLHHVFVDSSTRILQISAGRL